MWILYPLIFLSGFVDAIAGGGGIISVTAYLAVGLPTHVALGTNKVSAGIGTSVSTARFIRAGHVRWDIAGVSVVGALIGSAIGARLALLVPGKTLAIIVLAVLPLIAVMVLRNRGFVIEEKTLPKKRLLGLSALIGIGIGLYDGFIGPGTGTFLIMAFTGLLGLNLLTACGNAKLVNLSSNIAAAVTYMLSGEVMLQYALPCALCAIAGQYIGAGLAMRRGVKIVRPMILVVITLLFIKILVDLIA